MENPSMRLRRTLAALVSLSALAWTGAPLAIAAQEAPQGLFEWRTLNGRTAPTEFPRNSGVQLIRGSLELSPPTPATDARFELAFDVTIGSGAPTPNSVEGRYMVDGDALRFVPAGGEAGPPVTFRYKWLADGTLTLTDALRHVWGYTRVD
jgi:hypothetical protein